MDLGGLTQRMTELLEQAQAQRDHKPHLSASEQKWIDIKARLAETSENLLSGSKSMTPAWQDGAGASYVDRLSRSAKAACWTACPLK